MKKLFLIPAILLGFTLTANAQTDAAAKTAPATEQAATPQQKEYAKIEPSEVDNTTLMSVMKKYKGFSIAEANKAADGEYKLVLANKEGKSITAIFAKNGAFVKEA